MSVQWGVWRFDRSLCCEEFMQGLRESLAQWGPDGDEIWADQGVRLTIGARPFHVTHEDFRQKQPYKSRSTGNVITFDGRIDNRIELIRELGLSTSSQTRITAGSWNPATISSAPFPVLTLVPRSEGSALFQCARWLLPATDIPTDLEIVSAAFDRWNVDCFAKLRGDWALAIWEKTAETLWLARDVFGARHMHYVWTDDVFCWSTREEPMSELIRGDKLPSVTLTENFRYRAASAIALAPPDQSRFNEIRSVPPAHAVAVRNGLPIEVHPTSPPPTPRADVTIPFDQACALFKASLELSLLRRMRSAFPVTFELSGGCDSSSLVCLAYDLRKRGWLAQDLYTLTCFTPGKAHSSDLYYASLVEKHIGRRGRHIPVREISDSEEQAPPSREELHAFDELGTARLEHSDSLAMREMWARRAHYKDVLEERGSRVLLCGTGGDELAGGIQMAGSSLLDEWGARPFSRFLPSLTNWARYKRETVWRLLWEMVLECLPLIVSSTLDGKTRRQVRAARASLRGVGSTQLRMMKFAHSGTVSSWRSNRHQDDKRWPMSTVLSVKRRLCHMGSWHRLFPFIDADWVRVSAQLPPYYIQTAFQRRHLIRFSLRDIVPEVVLWRRTKDFGTRPARSAGGDGRRRIRDLEENAALFQVLRSVADDSTHARAKATIPISLMKGPRPGTPVPENRPLSSDAVVYVIGPHMRFVSDKEGATLLDISRGKRVVLNPTGAEIWRRLALGETTIVIAEGLARQYGVSVDQVLPDARELIDGFVQKGMLARDAARTARSEYAGTR